MIVEHDLHVFFQDFCRDFSSFDGQKIAERYTTPYLSLNADGVLSAFLNSTEIANYFQDYLNQYQKQGCYKCCYDCLSFVLLGQHSVMVSVTWQLYSQTEQLLSSWRESYNLRHSPHGLLVYASTDHV